MNPGRRKGFRKTKFELLLGSPGMASVRDMSARKSPGISACAAQQGVLNSKPNLTDRKTPKLNFPRCIPPKLHVTTMPHSCL